MNRRASVYKYMAKFADTLGYSVGDIVSYLPTSNRIIGIVTDIDDKIRKVYVDWGGSGNINQHDSDELQLSQIQDKKVRERMAGVRTNRLTRRIASSTSSIHPDVAAVLNLQFSFLSESAALYRCYASRLDAGIPAFGTVVRLSEECQSQAENIFWFLVNSGSRMTIPAHTAKEHPEGVEDILVSVASREADATENWRLVIDQSAKCGCAKSVKDFLSGLFKKEIAE